MSITPDSSQRNPSDSTSRQIPPQDTRIVRAAIHPAIGIARIGNSRSEYFLGPQVTYPQAEPLGFYRDAQGALKRQAVEFRLYGYNAAGEVVRELTADDADITWSAHIANHKASWFQWDLAMDISEAASVVLPRRNAAVLDPAARTALEIDGGQRSVKGRNSEAVAFEGQFTGVPVYLGELRTDAAGRLLFLGGRGVSASPTGSPIFTTSASFINADGWYDDTSDGAVDAEVLIDGRSIPVESAWVLTAPPNYAPLVKTVRTLHDLMYDLFVRAGWLTLPASVSFRDDVYPILQRLSGLQWVNQGFANQFGFNGLYDFENPAFIERLSSKPTPPALDLNSETRRQILNSFRAPDPADGNQLPWPWLYGDNMEYPANQTPQQNSAISATQYLILQRWAAGQFENDWDPGYQPETDIDKLPLAEQPAMLDRAALDFCLADAFHPGCEVTWPMRHLTVYSKPYRVRRHQPGQPLPRYGKTLNQTQALALDGPLHAQGPGELTRWMGLPWQGDTAWCRAGYDQDYDPFAPAFWPARVPNQVLSAHDYDVVVDTTAPLERRQEAFTQRTDWNKPLHGDTAGQMLDMVRIYGSMGLLEVRDGVKGESLFPQKMLVASYGPDVAPADTFNEAESTDALLTARASTSPTSAHRTLPRGANFSSQEEAEQAPHGGRRSR